MSIKHFFGFILFFVLNTKQEINMANQIDTNKLKQAEAASSIVKDMITSAIEQSASNTTLASEALKQASSEVAQIQTLISQVQSQLQTPSSLSEE